MNISVCDKRDLADWIKLRVLRWGYYSGPSGWAWCNDRDPYKEGGRKPEGGRNAVIEAGIGVMHFEDGERDHKTRNKAATKR